MWLSSSRRDTANSGRSFVELPNWSTNSSPLLRSSRQPRQERLQLGVNLWASSQMLFIKSRLSLRAYEWLNPMTQGYVMKCRRMSMQPQFDRSMRTPITLSMTNCLDKTGTALCPSPIESTETGRVNRLQNKYPWGRWTPLLPNLPNRSECDV